MSIRAEQSHELIPTEPPTRPARLAAVPMTRQESAFITDPIPVITESFKAVRSGDVTVRDAELYRVRRESVGRILAYAGVISAETATGDAFLEHYAEADKAGKELRGEQLSRLADRYDEHPFTETINDLQKLLRASQYGAEVIVMRRAGLVLLDEYEPEQ